MNSIVLKTHGKTCSDVSLKLQWYRCILSIIVYPLVIFHVAMEANLSISVLSHSKWRFRWFSVARMFNSGRVFILIHSKSLTALTVIHNYSSLFPSGFSIIIYIMFGLMNPSQMAFYQMTNTRILLMNLFWMVGLFNPVTDHSYGRVLAHTLPYLGLQHLGRREVLRTESVRMGFPWKHRVNICIICNHVYIYN